jgi:hypothetical protein
VLSPLSLGMRAADAAEAPLVLVRLSSLSADLRRASARYFGRVEWEDVGHATTTTTRATSAFAVDYVDELVEGPDAFEVYRRVRFRFRGGGSGEACAFAGPVCDFRNFRAPVAVDDIARHLDGCSSGPAEWPVALRMSDFSWGWWEAPATGCFRFAAICRYRVAGVIMQGIVDRHFSARRAAQAVRASGRPSPGPCARARKRRPRR